MKQTHSLQNLYEYIKKRKFMIDRISKPTFAFDTVRFEDGNYEIVGVQIVEKKTKQNKMGFVRAVSVHPHEKENGRVFKSVSKTIEWLEEAAR